jgi:CubicO group peptidase (beta-lactamase class C family)
VGVSPGLEALVDRLFDADGPLTETYACLIQHRGSIVAERYGGVLEHFDGPPTPVDETTPLLSWSMAKSMLHAVVGMLVGDGVLDVSAAAGVPLWQGAEDPRRAITLDHLLAMRDGLDFLEDYVDATRSDVIEMLFGSGQDDVASFAADRRLAAPPGTRFNYSSGTSNVVSGIVARAVGPGGPYADFVQSRLFDAIGMSSAKATFDAAGTWVASSFVHATARDFARFGTLYLDDGVWEGRRLLPDGWVGHGRLFRSVDASDGTLYGAHWWLVGDRHGSFRAAGYEGQSILVCPPLDLIVVRLGKTPAVRNPGLVQWRREVVDAFADA